MTKYNYIDSFNDKIKLQIEAEKDPNSIFKFKDQVRNGITVLSADKPKKKLNFSCYEITDDDIKQRDSKENLESLKKIRDGSNIIKSLNNHFR